MDRRTSAVCVAPQPPANGKRPPSDLPAATLIETLVAAGIVAIALTVFVSMLQLGVHSVAASQEQSTAALLARSQLETIKSSAWPGPYAAIATPPGYAVSINVAPGPLPTLQDIEVRVQHNGRDVLTVHAYKGQR